MASYYIAYRWRYRSQGNAPRGHMLIGYTREEALDYVDRCRKLNDQLTPTLYTAPMGEEVVCRERHDEPISERRLTSSK